MAKDAFALKINSFRDLEFRLGFNRERLSAIAQTAGRYYRPYTDFKGSKPRRIDQPVGILKDLQSRIQKRLLSEIIFPEQVQGGVRDRSPITNARRHVGARVVVMLDVRKCFPSITNKHIFHAWRVILGCSPTISSLLTKLTTFEGHLPQGSPTSTTLANIVLSACDDEIQASCGDFDIAYRYTRFVDDLVFSGDQARDVINKAVQILKQNGFRAPHAKLRIMGPKVQHQITGVVVNAKLGVARKKRAKIRAAIDHLRKDENPCRAMPAIQGKIGFVKQVNRSSGESLEKLLEKHTSTHLTNSVNANSNYK
jgi:RNA-directed DNA polymerase